jgi:hypothetical protein
LQYRGSYNPLKKSLFSRGWDDPGNCLSFAANTTERATTLATLAAVTATTVTIAVAVAVHAAFTKVATEASFTTAAAVAALALWAFTEQFCLLVPQPPVRTVDDRWLSLLLSEHVLVKLAFH